MLSVIPRERLAEIDLDQQNQDISLLKNTKISFQKTNLILYVVIMLYKR